MSYNSDNIHSFQGMFFKPYGSSMSNHTISGNLKDISWDFYLQAINTVLTPCAMGFGMAMAVEENWPLPFIPVIIPLAVGLIAFAATLACYTLALTTRALATLVSPVVSLDESESFVNYGKGFI